MAGQRAFFEGDFQRNSVNTSHTIATTCNFVLFWVVSATVQSGANSVITLGASTITLLNVQKTTLVADDFVFV
jgi:hypothetical protein